MGHIEFSREADLVVVAPATADLLARMAQGLADDLASTTLLATDKRALVAPAMNLRMWLHPATQRNVATLRGDGVLFVGPDDGEMACGEYGPGRMAEPLAIVAAIEQALKGQTAIPLPPGVGARATGALAGRHVVVTSGPTYEPIDPVRFIGNRSSGRQGHAIAAAAREAGAEVTAGQRAGRARRSARRRVVHVETAREMLAAAQAALPADIFIAAAAVADWRVDEAAGQKLKKTRRGRAGHQRWSKIPTSSPTVASAAHGPADAGRRIRRRDRECYRQRATETRAQALRSDRRQQRRRGGRRLRRRRQSGARSSRADGVEPWPRMSKRKSQARLIALCARKLEREDDDRGAVPATSPCGRVAAAALPQRGRGRPRSRGGGARRRRHRPRCRARAR